MDVVELLSNDEQINFLQLLKGFATVNRTRYYNLGAARFGSGWVWVKSMKRVTYPLKWYPGEPNNPATENCLSIYKDNRDVVGINDLKCDENEVYILCQKMVGMTENYVDVGSNQRDQFLNLQVRVQKGNGRNARKVEFFLI